MSNLKHGMRKTKIYGVWTAMISRCRNKNNKAYKNYGGRGISVCDEWLLFENFYRDMGESPENKTLDRIDNNKNYSKENCKWSTISEQAKNKRSARIITANGKSQNMCEWAREIGIDERTIWHRLKIGWSELDAVTKQKVTKRKGIKMGEKLRDYQQ